MKNITLAFLPGAKIGVLGINGAGKSTLLRIMAGIDHDISGEAWAADGVRVGYLAQEPQLDPEKDVLGNVMEGVAATKALLDRFNEVSAGFGDPDADMDALLAEQAELQEKIDGCNGWELERTLEIAMDALRCPPGDADVPSSRAASGAGWPSAGSSCAQPDMLLLDEPTNHLDAESVAWLERFLAEYKSTVVASPTTATSSTMSRAGSSSSIAAAAFPTRATTPAGSSRSRSASRRRRSEERARQRTLAREAEWIGASPARPPGQVQGAHLGLRGSAEPSWADRAPAAARS